MTGALFSDDRKYRYVLWRKWNEDKPMIAFIGLNPSKANEIKPDNTITKLIKVAAHNGYGGFYMLNLFGIVSAKPEILLTDPDPIGKNDEYLRSYTSLARDTAFCWGAFKQAKERSTAVINMLQIESPLCFAMLKGGQPKHPLYCLDKSVLIKYSQQSN